MGVVVRMKGKGFALVPTLVRFRYLDKWSDSRSWTGGELLNRPKNTQPLLSVWSM